MVDLILDAFEFTVPPKLGLDPFLISPVTMLAFRYPDYAGIRYSGRCDNRASRTAVWRVSYIVKMCAVGLFDSAILYCRAIMLNCRRVVLAGIASMIMRLLRILVALAIVFSSFGLSLYLIDLHNELKTPIDPLDRQIQIVGATYGLNCANAQVIPGNVNTVKPGNATETLRNACDKRMPTCIFVVNVVELKDPAPGCAKDFKYQWRCGQNPAIREGFLSAEANGRQSSLNCP